MSTGQHDDDNRPGDALRRWIGGAAPTTPPAGGDRATAAPTEHEHPPAPVEEVPVVDIPGIGKVIPLRPDTDPGEPPDPGPVEPGTDLVRDDAIEGELLTDEQNKAVDRRLPTPVLRRARAVSVQRTARVVRVIRESDRPKQAGQTVLRTALTIVQGFESWAKRAFDASTMGVYRRQIKAAEALGNEELLIKWTTLKEQAAVRRHKRLMDLPALAFGMVKAAVVGIAALVVLVLVTGLLVQLTDTGEFTAVITGVLDATRWVFIAIAVAWTPFVMAVPLFVVLAAWREGRRRGTPPGWLATTADADADVTIDETTIARALAALRIPNITDYLKQGLPLQFITPCRADGRGTHAVIRLPGVPAEKIAKRRPDLAAGLHRRATEVWPTTGSEAGILDLWIADPGVLAEGAGPYPLLDEGLVDIFRGVPFGKTLRGDPLLAPIIGRNTIVGGMPDQGKSSAARCIMCGAALDPTVELRIWVPDTNFDFERFKRRCSRYVMGAEDQDIEQICLHLEELVAEIQKRGELLIRYEQEQVTRELASKNIGMHPIVALLEEAHLAFGHPQFGKRIATAVETIVRLGRKRGIHMIISTQATTGQSVPPGITIHIANGIAFAVSRWQENDALLGQGAYAAGHRATDLIPGTDRGNAIVKGFTGERSVVAQAYYVSPSRDQDQVTPIVERALAAIRERDRGVPGDHRQAPEIEPARDLLDDLVVVLGDHPIPAADVPALLRELAPRWQPYRQLTGKTLRAELAALGVKVPSTDRKYPIDPVTIRDARVRRETGDPDEEG